MRHMEMMKKVSTGEIKSVNRSKTEILKNKIDSLREHFVSNIEQMQSELDNVRSALDMNQKEMVDITEKYDALLDGISQDTAWNEEKDKVIEERNTMIEGQKREMEWLRVTIQQQNDKEKEMILQMEIMEERLEGMRRNQAIKENAETFNMKIELDDIRGQIEEQRELNQKQQLMLEGQSEVIKQLQDEQVVMQKEKQDLQQKWSEEVEKNAVFKKREVDRGQKDSEIQRLTSDLTVLRQRIVANETEICGLKERHNELEEETSTKQAAIDEMKLILC